MWTVSRCTGHPSNPSLHTPRRGSTTRRRTRERGVTVRRGRGGPGDGGDGAPGARASRGGLVNYLTRPRPDRNSKIQQNGKQGRVVVKDNVVQSGVLTRMLPVRTHTRGLVAPQPACDPAVRCCDSQPGPWDVAAASLAYTSHQGMPRSHPIHCHLPVGALLARAVPGPRRQ